MINGILRLPDDSIEFIRNEHDFVKVIADRLGYDAGQLVKELVQQADETDSDFRSYESQVESMQYSFRDIHDISGSLIDLLGERRLNRKRLESLVLRIRSEISNYM